MWMADGLGMELGMRMANRWSNWTADALVHTRVGRMDSEGSVLRIADVNTTESTQLQLELFH